MNRSQEAGGPSRGRWGAATTLPHRPLERPPTRSSGDGVAADRGFVLTARFFLLLGLGVVPLILVWLDIALAWLTLVYDALLIGAAGYDLWRCEGERDIHARRIFATPISLGFANRISLEIANFGGRELALRILDEPPPESLSAPATLDLRLSPGATGTVEYLLHPTRRGPVRFGDLNIRIRGRLRLVWRQVRIAAGEEVRVYPDLRGARQLDLALRRGRPEMSGLRRLRFRGQGREFESLREFVPGDSLRHVAWSATARHGKLVTKEFQLERNQSLIIALDTGRLMTARVGRFTKMDHAVYAALGLVLASAAYGDHLSLITFCRQVQQYVAPKSGPRQLGRIMEALSEVQPQLVESNYRAVLQYMLKHHRRRALVVILTDIIDRDSSEEILQAFSRLTPRHLPLLLAMRDADLDNIVAHPPKNVTEVYQQGVVEGLRLERTAALSYFMRTGGVAVDCTPGTAARALIQQYLEIKERGLL